MKTNIRFFLLLFLVVSVSQPGYSQSKKRSFYEIKVYHIKSKDQEKEVDDFLKGAYLPALKREGIQNTGVFKPIGNDTLADKRIYVFIPFKSAEQFAGLADRLAKDSQFIQNGKVYLEAKQDNPPYQRMESIFLKAFSAMPKMEVPALKNEPGKRVYELRSYQSPTELIFQNKVHMFNEGGEVDLFRRLGFNAVFYGSVLSGSQMPNLMYMTTFEDMKSRDEHWKAFGNDPHWKKISAMPFYKDNVSKIDVLFLQPTDYSGI